MVAARAAGGTVGVCLDDFAEVVVELEDGTFALARREGVMHYDHFRPGNSILYRVLRRVPPPVQLATRARVDVWRAGLGDG